MVAKRRGWILPRGRRASRRDDYPFTFDGELEIVRCTEKRPRGRPRVWRAPRQVGRPADLTLLQRRTVEAWLVGYVKLGRRARASLPKFMRDWKFTVSEACWRVSERLSQLLHVDVTERQVKRIYEAMPKSRFK